MTLKTPLFAAAVALGLMTSATWSPDAFAGNTHHHEININIDEDIKDMSDAELKEAREEILEGLEEIQEGREEIAKERADEDHGHLVGAALAIADTALNEAEKALEDVLDEIKTEQRTRK